MDVYFVKPFDGRFLVIERPTGYMVAEEASNKEAEAVKETFERLLRDDVICTPHDY